MKIKTVDFKLPSIWASALINGDYSGLDDNEENELNSWCKANNLHNCIGCSDYPELGKFEGLLCELLTYTFIKPKLERIKNTIIVKGKRKVCRIYDNGGRSFDRYTGAFKGYCVTD